VGRTRFQPERPHYYTGAGLRYALNFADRRAYITLAYLGGLALLALIHLRYGWG